MSSSGWDLIFTWHQLTFTWASPDKPYVRDVRRKRGPWAWHFKVYVQQVTLSDPPPDLTKVEMMIDRKNLTEAPFQYHLLLAPLVSWCHHLSRSQDLESVSFCGELVQIKTLLMISQLNCKISLLPTKQLQSCSTFILFVVKLRVSSHLMLNLYSINLYKPQRGKASEIVWKKLRIKEDDRRFVFVYYFADDEEAKNWNWNCVTYERSEEVFNKKSWTPPPFSCKCVHPPIPH